MDQPWKVVTAFVGVFVAGAVFGGFFAVGVGPKLLPSAPAPIAPSAPIVTTTVTPTPAPTTAQAPKQAPNAARIPPLQVPPSLQNPQMLRRYAERLDLTSEQKENITPRIQRATEDFRRLWVGYVRETSIIVQRLQEDIRKELTPEQIAKLDLWEQRQKELLEKSEQKKGEQKKGGGKGGKAVQKALNQPGVTSPGASTPADTATSTTSTAVPAPTEKKE
jgi:hypothetical protein